MKDIPFDAVAFCVMKIKSELSADEEQRTEFEWPLVIFRTAMKMNDGRDSHLHGNCKIANKEKKPFRIELIWLSKRKRGRGR